MRFFTLTLVILGAVQLVPVSSMKNLEQRLVEAARKSNSEAVDRLIQKGADVNRDYNGMTPLQSAVRGGHLAVVSTLVEHGAGVNFDVLSEACQQGKVEIVKYFMDKGCNFDELGNRRRSFPIDAAIRTGKLDVVKFLIQNGATRGLRGGLLHASYYPEMTKLLLDNGADPNFVGDDTNTPLYLAAFFNRRDTARILLDYGATMRANVRGLTPFRVAMSTDRIDVLEAFVEAGYAINYEIASGIDPEVQCMLLRGGARNTPASTAAFEELMKPIKEIKSAVEAISGTSATKAFKEVYHNRHQNLIAFAFEARKGGVDLFDDVEFKSFCSTLWTEEEIAMVRSIISDLVYLGCNDINFFYSVARFLASEDNNTIRHAVTAFKYLAGSLPDMPQSQAKEETLATRGAILNEMMARASKIGLRPVVKALFGIYHEEWKVMRTMRLTGLPSAISDLVMNYDHGPFNPGFRAKALRKLMEAIRRH